MNWKDEYLTALDEKKMFESSGHRTRFKELLDCYGGFPFFTRGLCKCIYLSAWDEEHFNIMLETLTDMSLGRERNNSEMLAKGDSLAMEQQTDGERCMYQLSIAMLSEKPFVLDPEVKLDPAYEYIIRRALQASEVIDQIKLPQVKGGETGL